MTVAIKQRAHELIEALPDDATWQELLYALELRGDVEAGLADAKAGRVTDTEDLRRESCVSLKIPRNSNTHARDFVLGVFKTTKIE
jgi:predicted transcriptional regulator